MAGSDASDKIVESLAVSHLTFPNGQYSPAKVSQGSFLPLIAHPIVCEFFGPEFGVRF
jgi:hypothetical protein